LTTDFQYVNVIFHIQRTLVVQKGKMPKTTTRPPYCRIFHGSVDTVNERVALQTEVDKYLETWKLFTMDVTQSTTQWGTNGDYTGTNMAIVVIWRAKSDIA
jgi:hypothetical protein